MIKKLHCGIFSFAFIRMHHPIYEWWCHFYHENDFVSVLTFSSNCSHISLCCRDRLNVQQINKSHRNISFQCNWTVENRFDASICSDIRSHSINQVEIERQYQFAWEKKTHFIINFSQFFFCCVLFISRLWCNSIKSRHEKSFSESAENSTIANGIDFYSFFCTYQQLYQILDRLSETWLHNKYFGNWSESN